jgi:hypothetical protein
MLGLVGRPEKVQGMLSSTGEVSEQVNVSRLCTSRAVMGGFLEMDIIDMSVFRTAIWNERSGSRRY